MVRISGLAAVCSLCLACSSAPAGDPYADARESVVAFVAAIRDGDMEQLQESVYRSESLDDSMFYMAYKKTVELHAAVHDLVATLSREGIKRDPEEILKGTPLHEWLLKPEFFNQIKTARVFIDEPKTGAVSEISYGGKRTYIGLRKVDDKWAVVLDEPYDEMYGGAGLLILVSVATEKVTEAKSAAEEGDFRRAAAILDELSQDRFGAPSDGQTQQAPPLDLNRE